MRSVLSVMLVALATWPAAVRVAAAADSATVERELIMVLAANLPEPEKALACKGLAEHGSAAAVPELAKLLGNERLASWSRIALEAIPDPACDAALRDAATKLSGAVAVGAINSLGVRRDVAAVPLLTGKLADGDKEVAAAAAAALGKIGDAAAATALQAAFQRGDARTRGIIARELVVCAERLLAAGKADAAVAIYDLVRKADVPTQRVREATRGAILARGAAGVPMLVEQLRSTDAGLFAIGLSTARELSSADVDQALIDELRVAPAERAALLVAVLADRANPAVIPAIARAAESGPQVVRAAAVVALGRMAGVAELPTLLKVAVDPDADLAAAAVTAIGILRDPGVDAVVREKLAASRGNDKAVLLKVVGLRRIDAIGEVITSLGDADPAVRAAAITALGQTVDLPRMPALIKAYVEPRSADEQPLALEALRAAAVRMPDRDACEETLLAKTASAPPPVRLAVLEIVGQTAGPRALEAVAAAARDADPQFQDLGSRLLGGWATADAGPVLLELSKTMPDGKFRTRVFRGYLRVARQLGGAPANKAAMCRQAYEAARGLEDRQFVLEALASIPVKESLDLAVEAGRTPELLAAAQSAARAIMAKSGDSIPGGWETVAPLGVTKP